MTEHLVAMAVVPDRVCGTCAFMVRRSSAWRIVCNRDGLRRVVGSRFRCSEWRSAWKASLDAARAAALLDRVEQAEARAAELEAIVRDFHSDWLGAASLAAGSSAALHGTFKRAGAWVMAHSQGRAGSTP